MLKVDPDKEGHGWTEELTRTSMWQCASLISPTSVHGRCGTPRPAGSFLGSLDSEVAVSRRIQCLRSRHHYSPFLYAARHPQAKVNSDRRIVRLVPSVALDTSTL